ncbi:UNVERIFIED_ORG: glycosyl transferase family 1 [Martelella mediterranea]
MARALVLLWDNFGPLHQDRVRSVATAFGAVRDVTGIELCGKSDVYDWIGDDNGGYRQITLYDDHDLSELRTIPLLFRLIGTAFRLGRGDYVLCHWNVRAILFFAIWLRVTGSKVYAMGCSKYDDKPRSAKTEFLKSLMFLPYNGAIASGHRSVDYFRFMGIPARHISGEYNTVSIERIRMLAQKEPAPGGLAYESRVFLCVARLVPKKNLSVLLRAYARYCATTAAAARDLVVCGSGPLEQELRVLAHDLGVSERVSFTGFVQTEEVCQHFSRALALLLPSLEEQFGNVVPEAMSMGLPVILSDNAGARDLLVRSAVNGFVVEPDNPEGLAFFMCALAQDQVLWNRMAQASCAAALGGDVTEFARAIQNLTGVPGALPPRPVLPASPVKSESTRNEAGA